MKDYTVMVKRYGFITVEAEDDEDALEQVDGLSSSDTGWTLQTLLEKAEEVSDEEIEEL